MFLPCYLLYTFFVHLVLNNFMEVLDTRLAKKNPQSPGIVAKKVRKAGEPSNSLPPTDAPSWAIRKEVIQGL